MAASGGIFREGFLEEMTFPPRYEPEEASEMNVNGKSILGQETAGAKAQSRH